MDHYKRQYAIGIMSGTSADAVDAVVLEIDRGLTVNLTNSVPLPPEVQQTIRALNVSGHDEIDKAGMLDTELASYYHAAVRPLLETLGTDKITVIGCHGQTIRHRPEGPNPFTLQLGNGAALAQLTGLPVVTDFRSADMAAGGQGAPLAPGFHHHAFSSAQEERVIINIGGIANLTHLPSDRNGLVTGFDTGPGNTLMDAWIRQHLDREYDDQGQWAKQGQVNPALLDLFLEDDYFSRAPPKSTGLDYFNLRWIRHVLESARQTHLPADIQATLMRVTVDSLVQEIHRLTPQIACAYVCGGGARNSHLMSLLQRHADCRIATTASLGIGPQWVEAAAFGWMAFQTLHRQPSVLPSVTGAASPTIAGAVYFP